MQPQSVQDNFPGQSKVFHIKDDWQHFLKCPRKGVHKRAVGKGTIAGFGIGSDSFTSASHMQVLFHAQNAVK